MEYKKLFNEIENLYFNNKYQEILNLWEKNKKYYHLDYNQEFDDKILEALSTSYFETGEFKNGLNSVNKQIIQLPKLNLTEKENKKKLKYYYLNKINLFDKLGNTMAKYKTAKRFVKNCKKEEEPFVTIIDSIEKYFYKKYLNFNKFFGYFIFILISLVISIHFTKMNINESIYSIYNIFTIISVVWLVLNFTFPKYFKKIFISTLRYIFS